MQSMFLYKSIFISKSCEGGLYLSLTELLHDILKPFFCMSRQYLGPRAICILKYFRKHFRFCGDIYENIFDFRVKLLGSKKKMMTPYRPYFKS